MSLSQTPSSERVHIAFFGRRNAGKSSVVNAVTGQELAVVSDVKGTTTDPVSKAMELLPLGPVVIIDTPGIDDEGALGEKRVRKTRQVLDKTDLAVLVADAALPLSAEDEALLATFRAKSIPFLIAYNKSDLLERSVPRVAHEIEVSALTGAGIDTLKARLAALAPSFGPKTPIAGDLVSPGDLVVLVTPIDGAAPKGRLILPQQQTIRDLLDADAVAVVTKETGLRATLAALGRPPALVITDSQVFAQAAADTPVEVPLTSFSILFARYKGLLDTAVDGAAAIGTLRDGDTVLISEGCTHHRQCDDIGRVKLPRWLTAHTHKKLNFTFTSGGEFPDDLSPYRLVIHCGGCMLTDREVEYRRKCALDQGVPMTNYGVAIAYMKGILERSLSVFPHLAARLAQPER